MHGTNIRTLRHEAEYYNIAPLVKRLILCEELTQSTCGDVLFYGYLPPPCKSKCLFFLETKCIETFFKLFQFKIVHRQVIRIMWKLLQFTRSGQVRVYVSLMDKIVTHVITPRPHREQQMVKVMGKIRKMEVTIGHYIHLRYPPTPTRLSPLHIIGHKVIKFLQLCLRDLKQEA